MINPLLRYARLVPGFAIVIAVIYVFIALKVLPTRSFMINDNGVKYIQVQSWISNQQHSFAIPYPGATLDPDHRYSPFLDREFFYQSVDGNIYGIYSHLFSVIAGFFFQWFDIPGIYIMNAVAAGALALATGYLYWSVTQRRSLLPAVIVSFASPLLFYGIDFWEYTPTIFLSTLGIALIIDGLRTHGWWKMMLAGIVLGLAVWIRAEVYILLPICVLGILLLKPRFKQLVLFGIGVSLMIVPLWAINIHLSGSFMGNHVGAALASAASMSTKHESAEEAASVLLWLAPFSSERWMILLSFVLVGRIILIGVPQPWKSRSVIVYVVGITLMLGFNVVQELINIWRPISIIRAFPLIIFFAFLGILGTEEREQSTDQQRPIVVLALITLALFISTMVAVRWFVPSSTDWGPRYLLPSFPLFAVLIVHLWQQICDRVPSNAVAGRALQVAFAALVCFSVLTQVASIKYAHSVKSDFERLLVSTENHTEHLVVTDIWWLPHMSAPIFYDKIFFVVNYGPNGTEDQLLSTIEQHNIQSFTFVTTPNKDVGLGELPSNNRWIVSEQYVEHIWLDVNFLRYERKSASEDNAST